MAIGGSRECGQAPLFAVAARGFRLRLAIERTLPLAVALSFSALAAAHLPHLGRVPSAAPAPVPVSRPLASLDAAPAPAPVAPAPEQTSEAAAASSNLSSSAFAALLAPDNLQDHLPVALLQGGDDKRLREIGRTIFAAADSATDTTGDGSSMLARNAPLAPDMQPLASAPVFAEEQPDEPAQPRQVAELTPDTPKAPAASVTPEIPAPTGTPPARASAETPTTRATAETPVETPLPPVRPDTLAAPSAPATPVNRVSAPVSPRHLVRVARMRASPVPREDNRSIFEKLFGGGESSGQALAYAAPDEDNMGLSRGASVGRAAADGGTAIYDISAHTVFLPSGAALEAHSGLGPYFDDPSHVHLRMRGATPPAVYKLKPRESLFHGVQALRLEPISGSVYGRAGLLAHTFMLGPRGNSNGCVSFRNYNAFLRAYMNGEVKRLLVVAHR